MIAGKKDFVKGPGGTLIISEREINRLLAPAI